MPEIPTYEKTFDALTNGIRHDKHMWFNPATLQEATHFLHIPERWGLLIVSAEEQLGRSGAYQWRKAVEGSAASIAATVDSLIESTRFPFVSTAPTVPPLPAAVRCEPPRWRTWLHAYAEHSAYWAPRAAPGFHTAVGLWILSTIAARRIVLRHGSAPLYPTLFIALIAESTLWTKTTAASIGLRLIRRAGCGHLLGPDRTTPQFLLKLMSGIVPQDYATKPLEEQAAMRLAFGFAAQRGWFYEEWGGMLHQMRRVDSPQAELNKLLIVLEGGQDSFETGTIQRGLERINAPYLALLGNATPHDMAPFMDEGDAWWHDGFWPRFVCVTPPYGAQPSQTPMPREAYDLPAALIMPLHAWDARLGAPTVTIEEAIEPSGKRTGRWVGTAPPPPCHALSLDPALYDAFEAYDSALLRMIAGDEVHRDLAPWYARAKDKALRVAMLLASVHGEDRITLPYWQEAQCLVEGWRANMHALVETIDGQGGMSRQGVRRSRVERKIEALLALSGAMTARELKQHIRATSEEIFSALESMLKIGTIEQKQVGKKNLYLIFNEDAPDDVQRSADV